MTEVLMVYNEAGGQTKTASAVSFATIAALTGKQTLLVDLDPRAAATKWLDVQPSEPGLHIGAILAEEDPEGWAEQLAVPSRWTPNLRVIPSDRNVSNREADRSDQAEVRLAAALVGVNAEFVVIDCPNRQGGPLTLAALSASDAVVYACTATQDGVDGVAGARRSVATFLRNRERIGATAKLREAGIVVGAVQDTIISRAATACLDELRATGLLLDPIIPARAIVQETRITGEWYGQYGKGGPVVDAYTQILGKVNPA